MSQEKKKDPFRKTLHLPKTKFVMKANLTQMEPRFQRRWEKMGLYQRMRNLAHPAGTYLLHDGPPYANGNIHLGHMLNKVIKDIALRSKTMAGYDVEFVPGWDCHGQPIEHQVIKNLGAKAKEMAPAQIRGKCKDYASKFVKTQAKQMKALGTVGRYEDPYLTMVPAYEGATLEVFADLVERGLVYRAHKPVHWSIANQTALAEAELEYMDREDISVYVLFPLADAASLPAALKAPKGVQANLMIWTTTPWTLPANLAVAVAPDECYGLFHYQQDGKDVHVMMAEKLSDKVFRAAKIGDNTWLGHCTGQELIDAGIKYQHPFIDRQGPVLGADYVTMEDGTGMVHTAPGHGEEDYRTGLREGLDIYCPVRNDGTFDNTVPEWLQGLDVWTANPKVVEHLRASGHLFHDHRFEHAYPHDWRGKTPVIFRATEQWFIAVDGKVKGRDKTLRELAMAAAEQEINFVPAWGQSRLRGMLESRPDWCISRQRNWGLPIPAFLAQEGQEPLLTSASVRAVARSVRKHGTDCWYKMAPNAILREGEYALETDGEAPQWLKDAGEAGLERLSKSRDIFDVWFESGSSWNAVLNERDIGYPADVYIEGSDQHRGWFQLSLLPALAMTGQPPFKTLLTHGFIVDAQGRKMSKSLGNSIEVKALLEKYGADICRWWVSGLSYTSDIKADWKFFQTASNEYRKVRNTLRFLLGNLSDFNPETDPHTFGEADAHSIDAWVLGKLEELGAGVEKAYQGFQFARVREMIYNFCNDTLSAVYLAAIKDRLYCEATDSLKRRRTQTALFEVADALIRLVSPVLCHTADEAYLSLHGMQEADELCVHLEPLTSAGQKLTLGKHWESAMALRQLSLKALEDAKAEGGKTDDGITNPLDAGIVARVSPDLRAQFSDYLDEMADLCGVSRYAIEADAGIKGGVDAATFSINDLREEPRCERSWKRDGTVQEHNGHWLSARDAEVVAGLAT